MVQDKKTLFEFEIRPLFRYDIRKILSGYELRNFLCVRNKLIWVLDKPGKFFTNAVPYVWDIQLVYVYISPFLCLLSCLPLSRL